MSTPPETPVAPPTPTRLNWLKICSALIFGVGVALYARTLGYEFLDWDDSFYVVQNPWIQEFSWESLSTLAIEPLRGGFLPLQLYSFALDHFFWGLDPVGFHLHALLLNAANGVLAFLLMLRLSRSPKIAVVGALLFVLHSSHVASVAWVSSRRELLYTAFLLLSTLAYQKARRGGGFDRRSYALSIFTFALGALSKSAIAVAPIFLLLVDWSEDARLPSERRRPLRFHLATKLPYLLIGALSLAATFSLPDPSEAPWIESPLSYLLAKGHAAWRYAWVLLGLQAGQPIYDLPPLVRSPGMVVATLAPLVLPLPVFAYAMRRARPNLTLGLGWLLVGMIPPIVLPLVPFMSDSHLYAPSLGFCWLLAAGIVALSDRAVQAPLRQIAFCALLTLLPAQHFAGTTWRHTPVWQDSESLWAFATRTSRDPRAIAGLSGALIRQERFADAERVLLETPKLGVEGLLHLSIAYLNLERLEEALAASERAMQQASLELPPRYTATKLLMIRGAIFWQLDRAEEAERSWEDALKVFPDNVEAQRMLDFARLPPEERLLLEEPLPPEEAFPPEALEEP